MDGSKEEIGVKLILMLKTLNIIRLYLSFFVYFFSCSTLGFGLMFLDNLGQIAGSRRYSGTSTLDSLWS